MSMKKANTLTGGQFKEMLTKVKTGRHGDRDSVMLLLSFKCGLRSCEIARLKWSDVTTATGDLLDAGSWINLGHHITKGNKPDTRVLMHPELHAALLDLRQSSSNQVWLMYAPQGATGVMTPANVTVYLHQLYKKLGYIGCSSHTGRRSFITELARVCNTHGCSIKDVQELARHSDIRTTEAYIEPSSRVASLAFSI